jgi:hypothetical protein
MLRRASRSKGYSTPWFNLERLIDDSLIGTVTEIHDKITKLRNELAPHSLILKPISPSFAKRRADLELFAGKILPLMQKAA